MKMIKLLVLLDGQMLKMSKDSFVGTVYNESGNRIGCIYSVSKDTYKNRNKKSIKKLLVDSIYAPVFKIVKQ